MSEDRPLRSVRVDLDALMDAFKDHDYEISLFLDIKEGQVLRVRESDFEEELLHPVAAEIESHPQRYLNIPPMQQDDVLEDLAAWIRENDVEDDRKLLRRVLEDGIGGGSVEDFLEGHEELAEGWPDFARKRLKERVVAWLESQGLQPEGAESGAGAS